MKEKYSRRGAFHREMKKWGDWLTFDHLYSGSLRARGIHKEPEGFVIKDVYSGLIHVFPVLGKDASYVTESLQFYRKRGKHVTEYYSDNAQEFLSGVKALGTTTIHTTRTPGIPKTNSIIERTIQLIVGGVTTCVLEAGLPPCFWSYAAPCFCMNYNVTKQKGNSAWKKAKDE